MTQPDLFADAKNAKTTAIDGVEANADPQWLDAALAVIVDLAERFPSFTSDDIWESLAKGGHRGPREKRALGAVMRTAVRQKIARPLNQVHGSVSTVNHGRPLRVWTKF